MMGRLVLCAFAVIVVSVSSCTLSVGGGRASQADTIPNADSLTLIGKWARPVVGQDTTSVGFELKEDSTIVPINSKGITYKFWNVNEAGDSMTLVTERVVQGKVIADTIKYLCVLNGDTLVLVDRGHKSVYARKR